MNRAPLPSQDRGLGLGWRLRQALLRAPLFSDLDSASMGAVEHELTPLVLPGGAPLFRQWRGRPMRSTW